MLASVIIPVYNAQQYLRQCLDSVFAQTVKDFEIICIDDGSTDQSLAIIEEFAAKQGNVTIIKQQNQGPGVARNKALDQAQGQFVAFLDSDDYWRPTYLEELIVAAESCDADVAICRVEYYDMPTGYAPVSVWPQIPQEYVNGQPFCAADIAEWIFNVFGNEPWGKLFRRSFVEQNNLRFAECRRTEDVPFTCEAYVLAKKMVIANTCLMTYRRRVGTSAMDTNHVAPLDFFECFKVLKAFLMEKGLYQNYEKSFLNHVLGAIVFNAESQGVFEGYQEIHAHLQADQDRAFGLFDADQEIFRNQDELDAYKAMMTQDAVHAAYAAYRKKHAESYDRLVKGEMARMALSERNLELSRANDTIAQLGQERDGAVREASDVRSSLSYKVGNTALKPLSLVKDKVMGRK